MNGTFWRRAVAPSVATLALGLALAGCGDSGSSDNGSGDTTSDLPKITGTLNGSGSSAQQAAIQQWTADLQKANSGLTINYDPSGSGAGRKQFIAGGVQFAGSDAYMTADELTQSQTFCNGVPAFNIPDYISPIAVVFNVSGLDKLNLSAKTIADIFNGKVTTWDDAAIKADNPGAKLPSTKIAPVHRADNSGTQSNFTDYLAKASAGAWPYKASGDWPIQSGDSGQGTQGVVTTMKGGDGTIGFIDESAVQGSGLKVVAVKVGDKYVEPTPAAAAATVAQSPRATGRPEGDIAVDISRTLTDSSTYPIVLVSYLIACPTYADKATADLVKGFLTYATSAAGQAAAAKTAGNAPLSADLIKDASAIISKIAAK